VNGKTVELKGGNRRHDYPWLGGAVPEWLMLMDLQYKHEIEGINFLRTIYSQDNMIVYEQADKSGILIDAEVYDINDKSTSPQEMEQKVKEIVRSNRNHPSVMLWSFGNDSGFAAGSKIAQDEDPTRQVLPFRINPDNPTSLFMYDIKNTKTTIGEAAMVSLTASHKKIAADRGSVAIITADLTDINGNPVQSPPRNIRWKVTGPATLVGPAEFKADNSEKNSLSVKWYKGFPATNILRSTGTAGKIKVSVFSSGLASGSIDIDSEELKPDNTVFMEPLLSPEGRKPVARLIINLDRLDEVAKEIEYIKEPFTITLSDRSALLKSIRDFIHINNPAADTASVEFRALAEILAVQVQNNRGSMPAEDFNYNIDHYNNCRLIYSYIMATKLPPLFKETLRKYYSRSVITLGSEKNAGDEMNWLNWIPSGGTVVIAPDEKTKTGIKGVVYIKKTALTDIIATVYPQFGGFSDDAKERALTFISKMNPYVDADNSGGTITYSARPGEMILIPQYKFISE
jgi:hypothetical protein